MFRIIIKIIIIAIINNNVIIKKVNNNINFIIKADIIINMVLQYF